jgi:hypothetical protein
MSDPSPDECPSITEGWKLLKESSMWRSAHWINLFITRNEQELLKYGFPRGLRISQDTYPQHFRERIDGMLGILEMIIETQIK